MRVLGILLAVQVVAVLDAAYFVRGQELQAELATKYCVEQAEHVMESVQVTQPVEQLPTQVVEVEERANVVEGQGLQLFPDLE